MWIGSHWCWSTSLYARGCIPCNRDVLCPPHTLFRHHPRETSNHSPQGVETGDLRSSRHMSQVNPDIAASQSCSPAPADDRISQVMVFAYVCEPSARSWWTLDGTRRGYGATVARQIVNAALSPRSRFLWLEMGTGTVRQGHTFVCICLSPADKIPSPWTRDKQFTECLEWVKRCTDVRDRQA
jgi:hypothetical protein